MKDIRVLTLVTNKKSRFFQQQIHFLEDHHVSITPLAVPGDRWWSNGESGSRTVFHYIRYLPNVMRKSFGEYDLIHANYGLTAPAAIAQPNLPVVLSLWGSDLMGDFGWVSKLCAPRCQAIIVMSDEMAESIDQPCHVIPHGVDFSKFKPQPKREAQSELGWNSDHYNVLFPYPTNRAVKNYPRARRVIDAVQERMDRPVTLQTVWGNPHDKVPLFMNASDLLLVTSHREGSPNAVKEALACNLPVVATDVGDVADRIKSVSPSYVGKSDGELVEAITNVLHQGTRSNGREEVSDLNVKKTTNRIRAVYDEVLLN